jgi:hypothetical protein
VPENQQLGDDQWTIGSGTKVKAVRFNPIFCRQGSSLRVFNEESSLLLGNREMATILIMQLSAFLT